MKKIFLAILTIFLCTNIGLAQPSADTTVVIYDTPSAAYALFTDTINVYGGDGDYYVECSIAYVEKKHPATTIETIRFMPKDYSYQTVQVIASDSRNKESLVVFHKEEEGWSTPHINSVKYKILNSVFNWIVKNKKN